MVKSDETAVRASRKISPYAYVSRVFVSLFNGDGMVYVNAYVYNRR